MGIIRENRLLFERYLKTRDIKFVDEILVNSKDMIFNSIKSILRKCGVEEEKYQEYFGEVYLNVREKLIDINDYPYDDFAFYCLITKWIKKSVIHQLEKENELINNVIFFEDLKNDKQLIEYGLIDYFGDFNSEALSSEDKEAIKRAYDNLSDKQKMVFDMYFGFNGKSPMPSSEISKLINRSHNGAGLMVGKILRILRKSVFNERKKNNSFKSK